MANFSPKYRNELLIHTNINVAYVGSLFQLKFSLYSTTIHVFLCDFPSAHAVGFTFAQILSFKDGILIK